jgi:hypothetical protein
VTVATLLGEVPPLPVYALWHNGDHDEPVTITKVLGKQDGVVYYAIEGSQTGIPADQVEFIMEEISHG